MSHEGEAPIKSIERAARVLALFESGRTDLDLNEITRLLGFTRATAHRYCMSLRAVGLLRYSPDSGLYGLGARAVELGAVAMQTHPVVTKADPYLRELVERLDHTVVMTVWDGFAPVVVRVNDNTAANVRISVRLGTRLPTLESAQGLIYLAYSAAARRPYEHSSRLAELDGPAAEVRERGHATRSLTAGLLTVAVPVFGGNGVIATFAAIGTAVEMTDKISRLASELKRAAARLTREVERAP